MRQNIRTQPSKLHLSLIKVESRRRPNEDEMAHQIQEGMPPPQHILPQGMGTKNLLTCFFYRYYL